MVSNCSQTDHFPLIVCSRLLGALSNDPRKLAYFAGFYKGIQSAGNAVAWALDSHEVSYAAEFGSCWGMCGIGLLLALPIVFKKVKEGNIPAEVSTLSHAMLDAKE